MYQEFFWHLKPSRSMVSLTRILRKRKYNFQIFSPHYVFSSEQKSRISCFIQILKYHFVLFVRRKKTIYLKTFSQI